MMKTIWSWAKQVWQQGYRPWLERNKLDSPANERNAKQAHPYAKVEHFSDGVLVERPRHGNDRWER